MQLKKYILLTLAFCAILRTNAALYPVPLSEKLEYATLIVEGTIESQHAFWNAAHTMIFTSSDIKISKQFIGEPLQSGYADVLTHGGSVGTDVVDASDLLHLRTGERGVFCLYPNTFSLKDPATGVLLFDVWSSSQGFFKYDQITGSANAPFARYEDVEQDLYPLLEKAAGRPYQVIDPSFHLKKNVAMRGTAAITGFTPATVNSGAIDDAANNVLTITGNGFSNAPSSLSAVYFDDADDGTNGNFIGVAYNDPRIVSWTDVQIKIKVPTNAGTGTFYVTNSAGTNIASSGSNLNVTYAVLDAEFTIGAIDYCKEYNLMNTNGANGYTVRYSTNNAGGGTDFNGSTAKPTFQRALATWKTLVGFNVVEGVTTTTQAVTGTDGINVVQYDNTNTGTGVLASGTLAVCYSFGSICTFDPSTTEGYQKIGFDITVRSSASTGTTTFTTGPCHPITTEIDLETVLLHELGHAIGHGHINDSYQGSSYPAINPGKLMNYAVLPGVKRASPDNSALTGAQYLVLVGQGGHNYPSGCGGTFTVEMTPTAATIDARDECPTFPTVATSAYSTININLANATSNKNTDPQYTALTGTGTGITNTVFYAIKTIPSSGLLRMTVRNYATSPSTQAACTNQGVELAVYQVSSCPAGQAYPAAVATRAFTGNGTLADVTGLTANTNYLIVMDGRDNTFASFTMSFVGSTALPVEVKSFTGKALQAANHLEWSLGDIVNVSSISIERSTDGRDFKTLATINTGKINADDFYDDLGMLPQVASYRLKITELNGGNTYTQVVTLRRNASGDIYVTQAGMDAKPMLNANMQEQQPVTIKLTDGSGKAVWTAQMDLQRGSNNILLNIPQLASGMYLLHVESAAGTHLYTTKLLQ